MDNFLLPEDIRSSIKVIVEVTPIVIGILGILTFIIGSSQTNTFQQRLFENTLPEVFVTLTLLLVVSLFSFSISYLVKKYEKLTLTVAMVASIAALDLGFFFMSLLISKYQLIILLVPEIMSIFYLFFLFYNYHEMTPGYALFAACAIIIEVYLFLSVIWFSGISYTISSATVNAVT